MERVEVVPYSSAWIRAYADEAPRVRVAAGEWAVDVVHFGSTAVPGLAAKPVVDILIGATSPVVPEAAMLGLGAIGYRYLGEDARRPGRHQWSRRDGQAFNVSSVPHGGEHWNSNLAVRDFLRVHPDWVDRYTVAKHRAVEEAGPDVQRYQDAKRAFVDELRSTARTWSARSSGP